MAIKKYTKIGLLIFVPSLLLWWWADSLMDESTINPLTIALPTKNGEVIEKTFHIGASGDYHFYSIFDAIELLKAKDTNGFNKKFIAGDYSMILLRNGDIVREERIKCMNTGFTSFQNGKERLHSSFTSCHLKAGEYTLQLTNQSDAAYLDSTNPTLEIVRHISHETALFSDVGKILFSLTGLVGLFVLGAGFLADNEKVHKGNN